MNIFRLILSIFGLAYASLNQIRIAYDRIIRFLLMVALPALLLSYLLNIGVSRWDWWPCLGYISYLMGLLITLIFMGIVFQPEILILVGVTSFAQTRNLLPPDPLYGPWKRFSELVWLTVAWINIPFMFIGGVPFGANPFVVLAILSTVTIIATVSKRTVWRKVVLWSAIAVLATNLLSLAMPAATKSFRRWLNNKTAEAAIALDISSAKSAPESGFFAKVSEDCTLIPLEDKQPSIDLKKGNEVMVLDTDSYKASVGPMENASEGMVVVMLPNDKGVYCGGQKGLIPTRLVDWDQRKVKNAEYIETPPPCQPMCPPQAYAPAAYTPPAQIEAPAPPTELTSYQAGAWSLYYYDNDQQRDGKNQIQSLCIKGDQLEMVCKYGTFSAKYAADIDAYVGRWHYGEIGDDFTLQFYSDGSAKGTISFNGIPEELDLKMS